MTRDHVTPPTRCVGRTFRHQTQTIPPLARQLVELVRSRTNRHLLVVPLLGGRPAVGAIVVYRPEVDPLSPTTRSTCSQTFADQAVIAVRLHADAQRIAQVPCNSRPRPAKILPDQWSRRPTYQTGLRHHRGASGCGGSRTRALPSAGPTGSSPLVACRRDESPKGRRRYYPRTARRAPWRASPSAKRRVYFLDRRRDPDRPSRHPRIRCPSGPVSNFRSLPRPMMRGRTGRRRDRVAPPRAGRVPDRADCASGRSPTRR